MSEERQIVLLFVVAIGVAALGILIGASIPGLLEGDLVVDSYHADFGQNGTLSETYTYQVMNSGQYRMLFRFWNAPLSLTPLAFPYILYQDMTIPSGVIGYVKDYQGTVTLVGSTDPAAAAVVRQLAELNEVGIYNPAYYAAGEYTVLYQYIVYPPIEYDEQYAHLNIRLVDQHVPFRALEITYPAANVVAVYPHPASLSVSRSDETIVVTGSAATDEVVGIELLLREQALNTTPGFPTYVEGVQAQTEAANPWWDVLPYYFAQAWFVISLIAMLATPFLLLVIYYRFGREKKFTVPGYLSFTPNPAMKPWEVNLLFKGDAVDFDKDGYYATLLDLHRRGLVRIEGGDQGAPVRITVLSGRTDDPYEKRVLEFLKDASEDGVVDTAVLERLATKARSDLTAEKQILRYQRELLDVTRRSDPALIARYLVDGRDHIFPFLFVGVAFTAIGIIGLIVAPFQAGYLGPAVLFSALILAQSAVALAFPSTLFGHWKGDGYQEKLQWDAFAKFLSDLALMRKYAPADIAMWGEWLVYGTALGVGDRVEKAMKELDVNIPEAGVPLGIRTAFVPVLLFVPPSRGGGGGGFGGGGSFGGGGGFGGGGVGGR
ncbi:putative membrane protein [Methanolinea mesophila]|uniref:DUF2207 domain-containing protein n=1 Tax=Methanolinea mesophila TaxID=547055 RepID=UPI001AE1D0DA|nr:DUF2207 domain-containing protein [Methanolinea mesophila]MBP1928779.1 putative membrane protein [Methanolinea mesophila]